MLFLRRDESPDGFGKLREATGRVRLVMRDAPLEVVYQLPALEALVLEQVQRVVEFGVRSRSFRNR